LEDNPDDVGLTKMGLTRSGMKFTMKVVETKKQFIDALKTYTPDLILSDHSLPGFNSMEAYKIVAKEKPGTPFILLTGTVSEEFAVECLLAGIDDYILKSNLIRLPSSIERVLSKRKIKQEKETIEALHSELQKAYRLIEIKNTEMTDSINYARRIQTAIMPDSKQFSKEFKSGFVIYEPRDIVSGDMYWLTKNIPTQHNPAQFKIASVVDCTGHGIPGAFMSLLVSELLSQALFNKNVNTPRDALSFLNKRLSISLQRNSKEPVSDGCDVAICAFDLSAKKLYFAAANRPLWILRKTSGTFELLEFKGTKASIGSYTSRDQEFDQKTIDIQSNDRCFMFTDGITDQFGGEEGKKMGRKFLKKLLLESAGLEMNDQKDYLFRKIKEWQNVQEQVDDMLLMGIEIE
jgi:serine phosphatase RsbU (regulator of sigma subunit)